MVNEKTKLNKKVVKKVEEIKEQPKPEDIKTSEEIKVENKVEETKEIVKKTENVKKDVAIANGFSLKISPKQSIYICRFIRGKSPEVAIMRLRDVISEKRAIPMAGLEVGHRRGKGLAGGRFPKNACKAIIEIVKQAGANAVVAGIENPVITIVKSDQASTPHRREGRKAKRTHIHVEIRNREAKL
ncbi:MAG: uL22 family ribosomal protein [archaeon]